MIFFLPLGSIDLSGTLTAEIQVVSASFKGRAVLEDIFPTCEEPCGKVVAGKGHEAYQLEGDKGGANTHELVLVDEKGDRIQATMPEKSFNAEIICWSKIEWLSTTYARCVPSRGDGDSFKFADFEKIKQGSMHTEYCILLEGLSTSTVSSSANLASQTKNGMRLTSSSTMEKTAIYHVA